jgi:hypothetical protein
VQYDGVVKEDQNRWRNFEGILPGRLGNSVLPIACVWYKDCGQPF